MQRSRQPSLQRRIEGCGYERLREQIIHSRLDAAGSASQLAGKSADNYRMLTDEAIVGYSLNVSQRAVAGGALRAQGAGRGVRRRRLRLCAAAVDDHAA